MGVIVMPYSWSWGFSGGTVVKESDGQCRRHKRCRKQLMIYGIFFSILFFR